MKIKFTNPQNIRNCIRDAGCSDAFCQSRVEYRDNHQYRKIISEIRKKGGNLENSFNRLSLRQTLWIISSLK
ncbi:MAG: hypothetical protein K5752_02390 [Succinivibrionaceae bacterium]|nr:hypothetical protein [Succinivibrionaceae bacterium]